MAVTGTAALVLLVSRVLFGGLFAFMGLNHFMDADQMIPYTASKGVPRPTLAVYGSGVVLILGGLAILTGVYATVGAVLLAAFFAVTTPLMHDFWAAPPDEQQSEMTDFLKNTALFAASLAFAAFGTQSWAYAAGIGVV